MKVFEEMDSYGHEMIVFARDEKVGLKTIIAVHDTTLGPAGGGTRFWNYATEEEALYDVLRLSRGMSLKNAGARLKLGGGKAVIIGDPKKLKSREFFHAYGRIVQSLGGKYYTAEDVNTNTTDINHMHETTQYVMGTPEISGNPSPFTARGVYKAMKAGAKALYGSDNLAGKTVAVMGLGSVGHFIAEYVHKEGARLKVFDINKDAMNRAVTEFGAVAVGADEILTTQCDIFSPCALGAVLNVNNVKNLKCMMICGCANNVLVDAATGDALTKLGILYCPDYIVNAGGIINCEAEIVDPVYSADAVNKKVDLIYDTTLNIIKLAKDKKISTAAAADEYAMGIILKARK
ncbi:MAG: leucine dehydrogenase [Deltaproteobacteria bacterium]|jgi:leucine dehydrogenase|nr:leucine dehydrogenase [Deltaproteobacteria bacterium]